MNLHEFKSKIFAERSDVKAEYDALEDEYREKSKEIERELTDQTKKTS